MNLEDTVRPYTMLSSKRIGLLIELASRINDDAIPGDMVECGVCNGGSAAILAHFATLAGKKTWLFDSFEGLPMTTKRDGPSVDGDKAEWHIGECVGSVDIVKEIITLAGGNLSQVAIIKGWFHETFPAVSIPQIAMLNLDSDWYESEKLCLRKFYDSVSPGGFVYFDDFFYWPGCQQAATDFFRTKMTIPTFNRVEHSMWVQVK